MKLLVLAGNQLSVLSQVRRASQKRTDSYQKVNRLEIKRPSWKNFSSQLEITICSEINKSPLENEDFGENLSSWRIRTDICVFLVGGCFCIEEKMVEEDMVKFGVNWDLFIFCKFALLESLSESKQSCLCCHKVDSH